MKIVLSRLSLIVSAKSKRNKNRNSVRLLIETLVTYVVDPAGFLLAFASSIAPARQTASKLNNIKQLLNILFSQIGSEFHATIK